MNPSGQRSCGWAPPWLGFAGAPWTVATYMVEGGTSRGFENVQLWAYRDPESFAKLIDCLVLVTIEYLSAQIAAGAEIVQLFDSWAGILPQSAFRRWVVAPTLRIVTALRRLHPSVPIIGFPRGAGFQYAEYFANTGVTALGLDTTVPLDVGRDGLQKFGPVQGNLDPLLLVAGGAHRACCGTRRAGAPGLICGGVPNCDRPY